MTRHILRNSLTVLIAVISLSIAAFAQTSPSAFKGINIKNFGQMDERFYRGAQPERADYQALKTLGVKTIVDLQNDPTDYEKSSVEALGMKYVNIPMSGVSRPEQAKVDQFLKLLDDPLTGVVYVHCKAGIHRTGVMGAAYRVTKDGWNYDQAYKEMKNYQFTSGLVHGSFKSFVKDYASRAIASKSTRAASAAPSGGAKAAPTKATAAKTSN
jgi:protein tyrosine/serine phosphatase